jgi:hypothetical protein
LEQATSPQATVAIAVKPAWEMELISPNERKLYQWSDPKQLPTETLLGTAAPGGTPAMPVSTPVSGGGSGDSGSGDKPNPDKD